MTDYLLPECEMSNKDKIELFHIRTEMNDLQFNFGSKTICDKGCTEILDKKNCIVHYQIRKKKKKGTTIEFLMAPWMKI